MSTSYAKLSRRVSLFSSSGGYRLQVWVSEVTNDIPACLFVYQRYPEVPYSEEPLDVFVHVASYADVEDYPANEPTLLEEEATVTPGEEPSSTPAESSASSSAPDEVPDNIILEPIETDTVEPFYRRYYIDLLFDDRPALERTWKMIVAMVKHTVEDYVRLNGLPPVDFTIQNIDSTPPEG